MTIESFLAWKAEFDAERLSKKEAVDMGEKRLTGKELFLQNLTMNDSDLQFLSEGKIIYNLRKYPSIEVLCSEPMNYFNC